MNPAILQETVLRMVGLINARDQRQAAARGLNPPPGVQPFATQPRPQSPAPNPASEDWAIARVEAQGPHAPVTRPVPSGNWSPTETMRPAALGPGGATLDFLAPVGEHGGNVLGGLGGALDASALGPLKQTGMAGLGQAATALDAPRGAIAARVGEEAYQYVLGNRGVYDATSAEDPMLLWARAKPELVVRAHEDGFASRDGSVRYEGGRAVWEAFARSHLTGNLEGAVTSTVMDPLNLLGGPAASIGKGAARQGARVAAGAGDDLLRRGAGVALQGAGRAVAAPDIAYQRLLGTAGDAVGGALGAVGSRAGNTRVGAQIGRWFEANPRAQAVRRLNAWQAGRNQRNAAGTRAPGRIVDPNGISPGVAAQEVAGEVAVPAMYEDAFSGGERGLSNRTQAASRARTRLTALANALPEGEGRDRVTALWDDLAQTRADILSSTETVRGPGSDIRNAANRAELWLAELETEQTARRLVREAGLPDPPYRNTQPTGSLAASLDTLAWNPDEPAANAAREVVLAAERRAEEALGADSTVTANLRAAREAAEAWRTDRSPGTPAGPAAQEVSDPDVYLGGMSAPDRAAWQASLTSPNGRAADFHAADARLRQAHETVETAWAATGDHEAYYVAAVRYQEAWQEANRLLEVVKREDDAIEAALAAGTTPPDVADAVRGGGEEARAAMEAADESFTLGPIVAPEVEDDLARTFGESSARYRGRAVGEVGDEIEARILADKNQLIRLLVGGTSELPRKEQIALTKLHKQYPGVETLPDAAAMDVERLLVREMREAFEEEAGARAAGRFGRAADAGSRIYAAVTLLMPWAFPRYYLANLTGGTGQVLLEHGAAAARAATDPETIAALTQYARKGGDPLMGAAGDVVKAWGLGGFHPGVVGQNLAEAIWHRESSAVNRAGGRSRFNLIGGIDRVTGAITDPFRNRANGLEWGQRTGLWLHLLDLEAIGRKASFVAEQTALAARHGIDESDLRAIMDAHLRIDGAEVADSIGRLALARGSSADDARGLATEIGRKWASQIYKADDAARKGVTDALFSYEKTNLDVAVGRVIPFHYWMSRAIPFYAEQGLRHPGFAATYYRMYQATSEAAETEGWPAPLQTFAKLWQGPGGMMLLFNPIAAIGVLDFAFESHGGYTAENVSAVGQFLNRAGEYGATLLPWWAGLLNFSGYLGESPIGLDPVGTFQARKFIGTHIQTLVASGVLEGLGIEPRLLGKPVDQALQNLRALTTGWAPGSMEIPAGDPNAVPARDIRNILLRNHLRDEGLTMNQYLAGMAAEPTSPEGLRAAEITDAVLEFEMDGGAEYEAALREYAQFMSGAALIGMVLPGPKRTRQEEGLAAQVMSGAFFAGREDEPAVLPGLGPVPTDHDPGLLLDARDEAFVREWERLYGAEYRVGDLTRMLEAGAQANTIQNAPPETVAILEQQAAYHELGNPREQSLLRQYWKIAFGESNILIPGERINRRGERRHDLNMQQPELAALDQATRWELADAWLAYYDPSGEVAKLRELQGLYEDTHPEFGAYQTWRRDTREQWGTASAFRLAAVRANANYAEFVRAETSKLRRDGKSPSQIALGLDTAGMSLDGYLAYTGQRKSRFDPMPKPTGAPLPVASEGAPEGALGGGDGYGGGGSWDERVRAALVDTNAAMKASQRYLGVRLDELPQPMREAYLASEDYPDEARPPSDAWIYQDYAAFYAEQSASGGDASVEAFIASTSEDEGDVAPQFAPGVWPPQPIAP